VHTEVMTAAFVTVAAVILMFLWFRTERQIMGVNEILASIRNDLAEATEELVTKIATLEAQLASSETVDPALLSEVKSLAEGLASVVDNQGELVAGGLVAPEVVDPDETEEVVEEVNVEGSPEKG